MALSIVKVSPTTIRVRLSTAYPDAVRELTIDRRTYGSIGAISAHTDSGEHLTLGNYRTRDGSAMQPEYARLRSLLKKTA